MENFLRSYVEEDPPYMGPAIASCRICSQQRNISQYGFISNLIKCGHPPNLAYVFDDGWIGQDNE